MFRELTSWGTHQLVTNLFNELCKFMSFKFKTNLKCIALLSSSVLSKKDAVRYLLKLRKLNTLDCNLSLVRENKDSLLKLIISQNNINNPDTHPIGSDLSIELIASGTQKTLNIKQLDPVEEMINDNNNIDNNLSSPDETIKYIESFEYFAKYTLKLSSNKITPNINGTILHGTTDNKSWIRVRLREQTQKSEMNSIIEQICKEHPHLLELSGIAQFSKTIYEFYYKDSHASHCLLFFQNQIHVESIIFYSNLKILKSISYSKLLTLSSILKFYYCYNYKNLDFSLITVNDLMNLQRTYLYAIVFMYKDNMDTSKGNKLNTAMSCLSGNMPSLNIRSKSRNLEPLTDYERMLLGPKIMKYIDDNKNRKLLGPKIMKNLDDKKHINKKILSKKLKKIKPPLDLRSTSMSLFSLEYGMKHKVYKVCSDRDSKMFSKPGLIGGHNQHEVILYK